MLLAFTTVESLDAAEMLARGAVEARLAACVQIDNPVLSFCRWQGQVERTVESRLVFKCVPERLSQLEAWVLSRHPYETPEWLVVPAEHVGEKYLSWALANSIPAPS